MNDDTILRVAPRPDFEALEVPVAEDAPTRTADGRPWVRWAKYGSYSGWYAVGSRAADSPDQRTFWKTTFAVACACAGGTLDQVHCCGRGILALGGLGVTLRSGYAQLLLHTCLLASPERFVEVMAPAFYGASVFTRQDDLSPSGVAIATLTGKPLVTDAELREVVMLGATGTEKWTEAQKRRARLWVSCCSELLRDDRMDRAQLSFAEEVMPALLTEATKVAMKWPRHGARDFWQYTIEQQMLWALALVLALEDEIATEALLCMARGDMETERAYDATTMLAQIQYGIVRYAGFDDVFRARCINAMNLLGKHLNVTVATVA